MEFEMKSAIVAVVPLVRQHFFRVMCGCPVGLLDAEKFSKAFLSFSEVLAGNPTSRKDGMSQRAIGALRR
jgi:hypothetical protein